MEALQYRLVVSDMQFNLNTVNSLWGEVLYAYDQNHSGQCSRKMGGGERWPG